MINNTKRLFLIFFMQALVCNQVAAQAIFTAIDRNDLRLLRSLIEDNKEELERQLPRTGQTPLLAAISGRRVDAVRMLLELGAVVNNKSKNGQTPLQIAIMQRHPEVLELVLAANPDVNARDNNNSTALMYAMLYQGDEDLVELLIENGAEVDARSRNGKTALQLACTNHRETVALLLLKHRGLIDTDEYADSILRSAIIAGLPKVVAELIKRGANPRTENQNKQSSLHLACQSNSVEVAQLLFPHFNSVDLVDSQGLTPLVYAVYSNQTPTVRELLKRGANPNLELNQAHVLGPLNYAASQGRYELAAVLIAGGAAVDKTQSSNGFSPLHFVAEGGKMGLNSNSGSDRTFAKPFVETIRVLLAKEADVNLKNKAGKTPIEVAVDNSFFEGVELLAENTGSLDFRVGDVSLLHWASRNGLLKTLRRLIEREQIPVDIVDNNGQSPLHLASQSGHTDVVAMLLSHRADANLADTTGRTPLHFAALKNRAEVVVQLLAAGGDANHRDDSQRTALHLAAWNGAAEAVKNILDAGTDAEPKSQTGYTPMHGAAWQGHAEVVQQLADAGADINAADSDGWTPLHKAAFRGHQEVVKILLDRNADRSLKDIVGMTALDKATSRQHVGVMALLTPQK